MNDRRTLVAALYTLAGLIMVCVGAFLIHPVVGFLAGGGILIALGVVAVSTQKEEEK